MCEYGGIVAVVEWYWRVCVRGGSGDAVVCVCSIWVVIFLEWWGLYVVELVVLVVCDMGSSGDWVMVYEGGWDNNCMGWW